MFKLNQIVLILLIGVLGLSVRAGADAPTYSVSVGGGSFNPNPICGGMTATATVTGSLNVKNSSTEIQESGDSWGWTATVTGYAPSSTAAYTSVSSGITPPIVGASSGSATSKVTATAGQTTSPGYYQVTVAGTDSFNLTDSSTDPATVTSTSRSDSTTLYVTVVTVGDIQYNDPNNGWVSIPADFVAMNGTTSPVRAIPAPSDASFPSGQLVWGGIASGSGTTATATFGTDSTNIGDETISVTLGNATSQMANVAHAASTSAASPTPSKVSRRATTFKLTPKLLPSVTFPNRSLTTFGVGETVTLDFDVNPVGTPMPETIWSMSGSVGTLQDNGSIGERGQYYAGSDPGTGVIFKLSITTGPSKGKSVSSSSVSVIAPDNTSTEVRDPSSGDEHINGIHQGQFYRAASAGCYAIILIRPGNVSFRGTQFTEVNVYGTGTNDLAFFSRTFHFGPNTALNDVSWRDVAIDTTYYNTPIQPSGNIDLPPLYVPHDLPPLYVPHMYHGRCECFG